VANRILTRASPALDGAMALDSTKLSCPWCDVRIRQTLEWRSDIRWLSYGVIQDRVTPPPDTVPTEPPPDEPPPDPTPDPGPLPGGVVFRSDWSCATGTSRDQAHRGRTLQQCYDEGQYCLYTPSTIIHYGIGTEGPGGGNINGNMYWCGMRMDTQPIAALTT
jgi:hypothetical protein